MAQRLSSLCLLVLIAGCLDNGLSPAVSSSSQSSRQHEIIHGSGRGIRGVDVPLGQLNLTNTTIRVAVKKMPEHDHYSESCSDPFRWSWHMLQVLAEKFGFEVHYVVSREHTGGVPLDRGDGDTGNWSGLMNQLITQEVDMTGDFLLEEDSRRKRVDFSEAAGHTQLGLLIKRPSFQTRDDSLLAPFSKEVWIVLCVSVLLMGPIMWLVLRMRIILSMADADSISSTELVWFVVTGILRQSTTLNPVSNSTRILFVTWWLFSLVFTSFYTANLTAFMTFSTPKKDIDSLKALAESEVPWLAPRGDIIEKIVRNLSIKFSMQDRGHFINQSDHSEIIRMVKDGGYVYIDETAVLDVLMMASYSPRNKLCPLFVVPVPTRYKYSFAYPMHSPLPAKFDQHIRWLSTVGFTEKWGRQTQVVAAPCVLPSSVQGTKLRNTEMRIVYLMLLLMYGGGTLLLLSECILRRRTGPAKKVHVQSGTRHCLQAWSKQESAMKELRRRMPLDSHKWDETARTEHIETGLNIQK